MRVLILSSVFPNAARPTFGIFIKNRAQRMARHGEIVIVAPVPWVPFNYWIRGTKSSDIPLEENHEGLRVYHPKFFCIPGVGKCLDGFFYFLSIFSFLKRLRKKFRFELIDAHFSYPDGVAAALLARCFRVPFAVTVRGTHDIRHSGYYLRKPQISFALCTANMVICVSESLKEFCRELAVPADHLRVIPNGVDEAQFYPASREQARRELKLPAAATVLLAVGAFIEGKGHYRVLEALPELLRSEPNLLFVALGDQNLDPSYFDSVKELVRRQNLDRHVLLIAPQPHATMPLWMNSANLFCLATRSEGRCNAILEALACGVPVVTTLVGGNPELVQQGTNGFLAPFWEPGAFTDAVQRALAKQWDVDAISRSARRINWEHTTLDIISEYQRLMKEQIETEGCPRAV